jgi:hypothetical protein
MKNEALKFLVTPTFSEKIEGTLDFFGLSL